MTFLSLSNFKINFLWLTISIYVFLKTHHLNMNGFWNYYEYGYWKSKFMYFCPLSPHTSTFAARNSVAVGEHPPRRFVCWGDWGRGAVYQSSLGGICIPSLCLTQSCEETFPFSSFKEWLLFLWNILADAAKCPPLAWSPVWKHQSVTDLIRPITLKVAGPEKNPKTRSFQHPGTGLFSWICNFRPLEKEKYSVSEGQSSFYLLQLVTVP